MASNDVMISEAGQGADLRAVVMEALGVPATATWFEVRFAPGQPVTVTCEYHPLEQAVLPEGPEEDDPAPSHRGLNG